MPKIPNFFNTARDGYYETSTNKQWLQQLSFILVYTRRIRSRLFGVADVRDRQTEKQMSDSIIA